MQEILITTGLPYANGSLHLVHMLENIQADIWVRWQKIIGNKCIFICGDDAHGTPIMLSAINQSINPEDLIKKIREEHLKDFNGFHIDFDNYYTTHSEENRELTERIYKKLLENNDIKIENIAQSYDQIKEMFLPDRFIKGECPKCNAKDQYGDNCEVCGATYSSSELINPLSSLSSTKPIQKHSEHYFFQLNNYYDFLLNWIKVFMYCLKYRQFYLWLTFD